MLNITKGKLANGVKAVIYGPAGIGKTTLAHSAFPKPIFLDVEGSTSQYDMDRIECTTFREVIQVLIELNNNKAKYGYETIIIDSGDVLYSMIAKDVCEQAKYSDLSEFPFGQGQKKAASHLSKTLELLSNASKNGFHVVIVCHSKIITICDPAGNQYSMHTSKVDQDTKQVAASNMVSEWSDLLVFMNTTVTTVKTANKTTKAVSDNERICYFNGTVTFDAKNRFNLPDNGPATPESFAPIFAGRSQIKSKEEMV